ncbi:MAG: hypothetical protein WAL15_08510, partial [Xanthobacteraceae bacterium]
EYSERDQIDQPVLEKLLNGFHGCPVRTHAVSDERHHQTGDEIQRIEFEFARHAHVSVLFS